MQDQELTGKARVRLLLWQRLEDAGVKPCLKMTQARYDMMQGRVAERLSYMQADRLKLLATTILDVIATQRGDRCLPEIVIMGYAQAIEPRPFEQHPIVSSWLGSIEGPKALAAGYHVTLYRWLRMKAPPPPLKNDMRRIKEQAQEDNRRCEILRSRAERGVINDQDRAEYDAWLTDKKCAEELICAGSNRTSDQEVTA